MKRSLVAVTLAALVPAAGSASSTKSSACLPLLRLPPAAAAGERTLFGHVKSLTRKGNRFELRFDPALWLTGVTARRAKLEDTGSSDVPNDYYIRDESHRLLTYLVPSTARVTVLRRGTCTTRISVVRFANATAQTRRPGFWIRVAGRSGDSVVSLDQQYVP